MGPPQPVWKICLGQLSQNLQEAAELANVLQEVSSNIQVTGLTRALTARTSTSSGNPTHLSARERIKRAVPLVIESGAVPWSQLVAVVSSASLQEPNSPTSRKQPQMLEVNSGGAVYFLFFKLRPAGQQQQSQQQQQQQQQQSQQQQQQQFQQEQQQVLQLQPLPQLHGSHKGSAAAEQECCAVTQQQHDPRDDGQGCSVKPLPMHQVQQQSQTQLQQPAPETCIQQATPQHVPQRTAQARTVPSALADELPLGQLSDQQAAAQQAAQGGSPFESSANGLPSQPMKQGQQQHNQPQPQHGQQQPLLPFLQLHQQRITAREGVAVLKVGASRLAMQAEQFANELTRHLGIAAPDCRIVRQVGSSAAEWSAVLAAVQQLAEPQHNAKLMAASSSGGGSSCPADAAASHSKLGQGPPAGTGNSSKGSSGGGSNGSGGGSSGCQVAAELLAELSHLPCFLLMEFVEGSKLSDCPHALDPAVSDVGQLCEDVGRLFLLDMLLGNADRMSCPELGWRGNANNLLYAQPGSRHAGRAVAIDSCVARRPPALKASAEDSAVERLSQLVLAVPGVSLALVQQLLGALREQQQRQRRQQSLPRAVGLCTALSIEDFGGSSCGQAGTAAGGVSGGGGAAGGGEAAAAGEQPQQQHKQQGAAGGSAAGSAVGSFPSQALLGMSPSWKSSAAGSVAQAGGGSGAGLIEPDTAFSEQEVAQFQAGLRQCLDGVLQIKGLLEMVSGKIADWIAEFVEDVVRLNPALLPNPTSPSPAALMRSPKPSPRVSGRGSFSNIKMDPMTLSSGSNSSSIGGAQDAAAAAALPPAGAGPGSAANGSSTSTSSRLSAPALTGPGSLGDVSVGRSAAGQQPEAAALPPPRSPAAAGAAAPPAASSAGGVEQQSTVSEVVQQSPAAAAEDSGKAGHEGSSNAGMSSTPPRSLFKQLVGHSKGDKKVQVPLTHRFAAIKAAICSPTSSSSSSKDSLSARSPQPQQPPADATASSPALPATHGPSAAPEDMGTPPAAAPTTSQHCSTPCSPPTRSSGSRSDPPAGTEGPRSSSSDLATAVAAALSPRATAAQAEVLAGLFGGRSPSGRLHRSLNGAVGSSSSSIDWGEGGVGGAVCVLKPPCARRVTWSAADEPCGAGASAAGVVSGGGRLSGTVLGKACGGPSILEPPAHKSLLPSNAPGYISPSEALPVAGWSSASAALPPIAGSPSRAPPANPGSNNSNTSSGSSRNSSSSPVPGPGQPHQAAGLSPFAPAAAGREIGQGLPSCSPTPSSGPPGHFDNLSFLHRQHNTRHLSFTSGGGGGDVGGGGSSNSPAAVSVAAPQQHPPQQRSSSSSLQVLASLQLDATLASITQEARHDGALAERLAWWKAKFKERGAELSAAIAAWQQRHQLAAVLSTGFLDGSHPIVDAYELGVRLQHMLRRLTALAAGALVQVPIMVLPGVFLGNAVAADSHHLLQYLGVTHVLNAAAELQLTPYAGMFHVLRVAIRDEEEEDVAAHFTMAQGWIDAALSSGGAVLVHCHEGKSRSVTLLVAYLMLNRGLTLAAALQHMRSVQPKACPNAGFMAQLMRLDQSLHGTCSIQPSELPRAKPEARICSICGAPAGISYASLVRHTKAKHGLAKPPVAPALATTNAAAAGGSTV